jgi:holo-[acyl-carrier protein] synthase
VEGNVDIVLRWAAKEAIIKAFRWQRITMQDITIRKGPLRDSMTTGPRATVTVTRGVPPERETVEFEVQISISHDGDYATAVCLAAEPLEPPREPQREDS